MGREHQAVVFPCSTNEQSVLCLTHPLSEDDQSRIVAVERRVVAAFARTIAEVRGDDPQSRLGKPMAMLLFGMINWMFTWLKPDRELDHDAIGVMVAELFVGGVKSVQLPSALAKVKAGRGAARKAGAGPAHPLTR